MMQQGATVRGVTVLCDEVFLVRDRCRDVEVYDATSLHKLKRHLAVNDLFEPWDITSCHVAGCLYIADGGCRSADDVTAYGVHRVDVTGDGGTTKWSMKDWPTGVAIVDDDDDDDRRPRVLVTFAVIRRLRCFSTTGELVREIHLPDDVINPSHAVQVMTSFGGVRRKMFAVCHGWGSDHTTTNRLCIVDSRSGRVVRSYPPSPRRRRRPREHGGDRGCPALSAGGHRPGAGVSFPAHLAVDSDGCILLADCNNRRVLIFDASLRYARTLLEDGVHPDGFECRLGRPDRLCLDERRARLYVNNSVDRSVTVVGVTAAAAKVRRLRRRMVEDVVDTLDRRRGLPRLAWL